MKNKYTFLFILSVLPIIMAITKPIHLPITSEQYTPIHLFLEITSIIICSMIFVVGWISKKRLNSGVMVLISCIFLSVGLLDFFHTLTLPSMPIFITANTIDKNVAFWMAARFVSALGLLALALFLHFDKQNIKVANASTLLGLTLFYVSLLVYVLLNFSDSIPLFHQNINEINPYKKNAEYIISLLGLVAAYIFYQNRHKDIFLNVTFLVHGSWLMAINQFLINSHGTLHILNSLVIHIYKVIAYFLLYKAVVIYSIDKPYEDLENLNKDLDLSISASNTGLWSWNVKTNEVIFSDIWKSQLGYTEEPLKSHFSTLEQIVHPSYKEDFIAKIKEYIATPGQNRFEFEYRLKKYDGSYAYIVLNGIKKTNHEGEVISFIGAHVDITERKHQEEHIQQLANFDSLTGLPNRHSLHAHFDKLLEDAKQEDCLISLMFIDLDHFKNINDTLGHNAGDELLIEVGSRLQKAIGANDFISRLGGDEFVVAIRTTSEAKEEEHIQVVKTYAENILKGLSLPYALENNEFSLTPSIGIATYPTNGSNFTDLSKYADMAMYEVKESGRNNYVFFNDEIHQKISRHLKIRNSIKNAIEKGEFFILYQPQFDVSQISKPRLLGFEALVRWNHPSLGNISPNEFIPIAENTGAVVELGDFVMRTVCKQINDWSIKYGTKINVSVSVNISPIQFNNQNLINEIISIIKEYNIRPSCIRLELTEGTMMKSPQQTKEIIKTLKEMGILLEIDDFGTGYSSLNYLKEFDVHKLKIDRSFIKNINRRSDSSIVKTIIEMAKNLNFKVIAEGVENEEQLRFLHKYGCHEIQGYYLSEPLTPKDAEQYMNK